MFEVEKITAYLRETHMYVEGILCVMYVYFFCYVRSYDGLGQLLAASWVWDAKIARIYLACLAMFEVVCVECCFERGSCSWEGLGGWVEAPYRGTICYIVGRSAGPGDVFLQECRIFTNCLGHKGCGSVMLL